MTASTEAELEPPRLTARGVILSLLVSNYPSQHTPGHMVRAAGAFDIKESAARVALSRMVTHGDLIRTDEGYELSAPLLERRQRVFFEVKQTEVPWNDDWETVIVTETGRDAADRAALRTRLARLRLSELREGVWMRPANLARPLALENDPVLVMRSNPGIPAGQLISQLWDTEALERESQRLLNLMARATTKVERFTVATAIVRHLLKDPVLPDSLQPSSWSTAAVHQAWLDYQEEFTKIPELIGD